MIWTHGRWSTVNRVVSVGSVRIHGYTPGSRLCYRWPPPNISRRLVHASVRSTVSQLEEVADQSDQAVNRYRGKHDRHQADQYIKKEKEKNADADIRRQLHHSDHNSDHDDRRTLAERSPHDDARPHQQPGREREERNGEEVRPQSYRRILGTGLVFSVQVHVPHDGRQDQRQSRPQDVQRALQYGARL